MEPNNNVEFKRNQHFSGIELCNVINSNHIFPVHTHEEFYAFSLMLNGGSYWTEKNKKDSLVEPGNIAIISPGITHSGSPYRDNNSTYNMMYIDKFLFKDVSRDILDKDNSLVEFSKIIMNSSQLNIKFMNLYNSLINGEELIELDCLLTNFINGLIVNNGEKKLYKHTLGLENRIISDTKEFLSQNLDLKLSLEDVAKVSGLSRYHFLRVFKKHVGVSPHIYRTLKRIEMAKTKIKSGEAYSDVALEVGFSDQSHFTNKFRTFTGATPKQYFTINN